ncbi:MAG: putative transrane protein, partial [Caulobacteraceae bacterium]|nr:putative transrane protein [Caulobacteraceae bacterium]
DAAQAAAAASPLPIKAAYLYKFGSFVDWPASSFAAPDAPLNLCVQGDDPFGIVLDESVAGQQVSGHPLALRRLPKVDKDSPCQILFIAGARAQSAAAALAAVKGAPVLTITDGAPASARGMIDFELVRSMVRFSIDQAAAQQAQLTISSKLLSLAVGVRSGGSAP